MTPKDHTRSRPTPQEPPVQVTIGRIEVRSVREEPPAPRQVARPRPRVTLGDYARLREARR